VSQPEKNIAEVYEVLKRIEYPDHNYAVGPMEDGYYIQLVYKEPDVDDPDAGEVEQRGRKWYVSRFATDSEIVQTCLVAALWSAEHRVREWFRYRPQGHADPARPARAIYGPHFSADALWEMAGQEGATDARIPPEAPPAMKGMMD
jgi:hypothetical protein